MDMRTIENFYEQIQLLEDRVDLKIHWEMRGFKQLLFETVGMFFCVCFQHQMISLFFVFVHLRVGENLVVSAPLNKSLL